MKVTNTSNQQLAGVGQKKTDKVDKANVNAKLKLGEAELAGSSTINLSPRAQDIKKATDIAKSSSPDVDEAKVAKFQSLIDSGKYKVDSNKVADKLVDESLMNSLSGEDY